MRFKLIFSKRLAIILLAIAIISCILSRLGSAGESENLGTRKLEGMVFIKGGCYDMGDTFGDGGDDEKPVHKVCVDDFYLGETEVTQAKWEEIMGSNPSRFKGSDLPVETVSWDVLQGFIERLNQKTGMNFRLPTEAEWEYAARSGGRNEKYAGISNEAEIGEYAWYKGNSGEKTHPVKQKRPNGLGLYDMTGNVWEWVSDWYKEDYYKSSPKDNPKGPPDGKDRLVRGGSLVYNPRRLRVAFRYRYILSAPCNKNVGFRLALSSSAR